MARPCLDWIPILLTAERGFSEGKSHPSPQLQRMLLLKIGIKRSSVPCASSSVHCPVELGPSDRGDSWAVYGPIS